MLSSLYRQMKRAIAVPAPRDRPLNERALVATLALGSVLLPLNTTMITVALPQISQQLGSSPTMNAWIITAYLIPMACLQPVAGRLGDRFGRRRFILWALVCFGLAALGAALASSPLMLLLFRMFQAIAGAAAFPNAAALIGEVIPAERRASSFGMLGTTQALGATAGPALAGLLVGLAGWPAIFWINMPLVLAVIGMGWRFIPFDQPRRADPPPFDLAGVLLLPVLLLGTAGLLVRGSSAGPAVLTGGALILLLGAGAFLWRELHHPDPMLQPRFFRRRAFAAANAIMALSYLVWYSVLLVMPVFLAQRAGWTDVQIGAALSAQTGAMMPLGLAGGLLADRFGRRWPAVIGMALLLSGAGVMLLLPESISGPLVVLSVALVGGGLGLAVSGLQASVIESVRPDQSGVAFGVLATSIYFGTIVGSSFLGNMLGPARASGDFNPIFLMLCISGALAFGASFALINRPSYREQSLE